MILISEKISHKYGINPEYEYSIKHRRRKRPKKFGNTPQSVHFSRYVRLQLSRHHSARVVD